MCVRFNEVKVIILFKDNMTFFKIDTTELIIPNDVIIKMCQEL